MTNPISLERCACCRSGIRVGCFIIIIHGLTGSIIIGGLSLAGRRVCCLGTIWHYHSRCRRFDGGDVTVFTAPCCQSSRPRRAQLPCRLWRLGELCLLLVIELL